MRRPAAFALALLLAGCAPSYPIHAPPPTTSPGAPQPAPPRRSSIRPPQVSVKDQCGAAALQGLVGRPRTEIPIPLIPARQRVACTTCPVTLDYSPERLNFFFDAETGIIKEIRCG